MIKNADKISKIIEDEVGCPHYTFKNHNKNRALVEFQGFEIFINKDIEPQEFRAKVAEAFLDEIQHLLQHKQAKLNEAQREVKNFLAMYNHYYDIVENIADEQLKSLEMIDWKEHKHLMR